MKHSRRKSKITAGGIVRVIIVLLFLLAAGAAAVRYMSSRVESEYAQDDKEEASSAQVTRGSISTSVYGSGRLYDDDEESFTIPEDVELEEIYVQPGEKVEEGQLFATVNLNSVLTAMAALEDEIAALDSQINSASIQSASGYLSSSVYGRVKKIYAETGDSVADVMREHGALMLLSLDGFMALDVEIGEGALFAGESVTLVSESSLSYPGTVDSVLGNVATVLLSDQGTVYGERLEVISSSGESVGSGVLYIHSPLKVIGYTGTVSFVNVRDNSVVYSGSTLLSLSDMSNSAKYEGLLRERAKLEDEMGRLIRIYRDGAIYFELSGTVKTVSASDAEDRAQAEAEAAANGTTATTTENAVEYYTLSPDKSMSVSLSVDESDILSVSVGQSATVTVDALDDQSFSGSVTEIDRVGESSSGVTSYTALVSIEKSESMLAGMSASATISIEGVENALLIPVDALKKTSTSYYVYTALNEDGTPGGMREVSVGISNAQYVEIKDGLSEGETVYYYENEDEGFFGGGMSGMGSGMSGMGGGMPGMGGGRPNMGGGMPNMGGGMPGGSMGGRR